MAYNFKKGDIVRLRNDAMSLRNPFGWNDLMIKCIGHMFIVSNVSSTQIQIDFYPDDPEPYKEKPRDIHWAWAKGLFEPVELVSKFEVSSNDLSALLET